ncbi:MAG: PilZ domain-containing protein [Defluviitaleaceae bacterium]|nr:PilZ domain-containing protein [Defluviitaleaceae bacterium]
MARASTLTIKTGMKIIMEFDNPNKETPVDPDKISLASYVEEVVGSDTLLIQMPTYRGYNFPLPRDEAITAYFFSENRMYVLDFKFLRPVKSGQLEFAKVQRLSELKPHQRRECFRLETSLPITVVNTTRGNDDDEMTITESQMIDISDGGVKFGTNDQFDLGDELIITIDIGQEETVKGVVLRTESTYGVGIYKRRIGVRFIHTNPRQKERFYKFIMDKQREILSVQFRN